MSFRLFWGELVVMLRNLVDSRPRVGKLRLGTCVFSWNGFLVGWFDFVLT